MSNADKDPAADTSAPSDERAPQLYRFLEWPDLILAGDQIWAQRACAWMPVSPDFIESEYSLWMPPVRRAVTPLALKAPEGEDPMRFGDRSIAESMARLKAAYCVQQPAPVPDQMALVWRFDIGRLRSDWLRLNAWQTSQLGKRTAAQPDESAEGTAWFKNWAGPFAGSTYTMTEYTSAQDAASAAWQARAEVAAAQATEREAKLAQALRWALEWIDAVPDDVTLPGMPGFDRDYVNGLLEGQTNEQED
jgi:hypothetical protein